MSNVHEASLKIPIGYYRFRLEGLVLDVHLGPTFSARVCRFLGSLSEVGEFMAESWAE